MITPNMHYRDLKDSYLFFNIAKKTKAYLEEHPGTHLYRMGIGDVSLPLCDAVIKALHEAVDDQAICRSPVRLSFAQRLRSIIGNAASIFRTMKFSYQAVQATSSETSLICSTAAEALW